MWGVSIPVQISFQSQRYQEGSHQNYLPLNEPGELQGNREVESHK